MAKEVDNGEFTQEDLFHLLDEENLRLRGGARPEGGFTKIEYQSYLEETNENVSPSAARFAIRKMLANNSVYLIDNDHDGKFLINSHWVVLYFYTEK